MATVLFAASAVVLGAGMVAEAQQYPPEFSVSASRSSCEPGLTVTVEVAGCTLGETIDIDLAGSTDSDTCAAIGGGATLLAFIGTPSTGSASASVTAPRAPGTYRLAASESGTGISATTEITVTAAQVTDDREGSESATTESPSATSDQPAGTLPATGSNSTNTTLLVAAGLFAMGLLMLGVAQYRRRRPGLA